MEWTELEGILLEAEGYLDLGMTDAARSLLEKLPAETGEYLAALALCLRLWTLERNWPCCECTLAEMVDGADPDLTREYRARYYAARSQVHVEDGEIHDGKVTLNEALSLWPPLAEELLNEDWHAPLFKP